MESIQVDRRRTFAQSDEILQMLRAAGDRGSTNAELWSCAHAISSRISDLRKRGHTITCVREHPGLYRYTLHPPVVNAAAPAPAAPSPQPPADLPLFATIEEAR